MTTDTNQPRRSRARTLHLSLLAVFALMACMASTAQATGEFKIGGKTFGELGITEETISGTKVGTAFEILLEVSSAVIVCKKLETTGGKILLAGVLEVTQTFSECSAWSTKTSKEIASCTVDNFQTSFKGEIFLHGPANKPLLLVKPSSGTIFTTIKTLGASCPLSPEYKVEGVAVYFISDKNSGLVISAVEKPEALYGVGLKAGGKPVFLMGAFESVLTGKFEGSIWEAV